VRIEGLSLVKLRLILGAIIAVVVLHATPTTPLPTYRDHGSAFSASTAEVAVLLRRDSDQKLAIAPQPLPPLLAAPPIAVRPLVLRQPVSRRPRQRGPPLLAPARLPHASPRGPPFQI
jgi:hypothetical protein